MTVAAFLPTASLTRVGHRELRDKLGPILEKVSKSHGAVEVVNRGRAEAVVMAHDVFVALVAARRELDDLRGSVGLLLAAVSAGAAVPSDTLDRLGITVPVDFDALQSFQAAYPAQVTRAEDGQALSRTPAPRLESDAADIDEPDEVVDVDD